MQCGVQSRWTHLSLYTEERLISLTAHPSHNDSTGDGGYVYMHTVFEPFPGYPSVINYQFRGQAKDLFPLIILENSLFL